MNLLEFTSGLFNTEYLKKTQIYIKTFITQLQVSSSVSPVPSNSVNYFKKQWIRLTLSSNA